MMRTIFALVVPTGIPSELTITDPDLQNALKERMEQDKKRRAAEAAEHLVGLVTEMNNRKAATVREIRRLKRLIDAMTTELDELDAALAVGNQTGDFVPLLVKLHPEVKYDKEYAEYLEAQKAKKA